jgi:DNA-binding winged helix-turn-helix (wHTH) protein/tetratricopeptide (TPR) repeat protein
VDRAISIDARRIDLVIEPAFQLGGVRIDPSAHEFTTGAIAERMQPQTLKVLIALHDKTGQVVTRDELVDRCWDGRIVGEDVINRCISILRRVAAEAGGFRIETVPRAGYRLVEASIVESRQRTGWMARMAAAALLLLAAGVGSWWFVSRSGNETRSSASPIIDLVPFEASGQPPAPEVAAAAQQAVTETLDDEGLTVRAAVGAFRSKSDATISGSVVRAAGTVQTTVRIERSSDRLLLSSLQFEMPVGQAGALPAQVGAQVEATVFWMDALLMLERRHPDPSAVTTQSLQQMNLLATGEDPLRVYPAAKKLARAVPNSALAQLLLGMNTGMVLGDLPTDQRTQALAAGRRAAKRAQFLAPNFGPAYIPQCLLQSQARMIECEDSLRAGLRADPDAPLVPQYLSEVLSAVGRNDEALQFARLGFADDRYMPGEIARLLRSLETAGQPDSAATLYRQARQWWPDYQWLFWARTGGMLERGDFNRLEAIESEPYGRGLAHGFETPALFAALRRGNLAEAQNECRIVSDPSIRIVLCMLGLARLGDLDGAYRIADRLYPRLVGETPKEEEELWLRQWEGPPYQYLMGAAAEPMRRDPRFLLLAKRTGLLTYWRSGRLPDFCTQSHEPICSQITAGRS